ncbi:MAG: chain-length determining protein [Prevotella sp.]|nr:chain-length determining protein [Prevotella sp.]
MASIKNNEVIDLKKVVRKIINRRSVFYKTLPIVFVISCIYIFFQPRYYQTGLSLAPETDNSMGGGSLSSLASSFGFDIDQMQTSDAISPLLYPDLLEDNGFAFKLSKIKIRTSDGEIDTDYYDYLKNYQKHSPWGVPFNWIKSLFPKDKDNKDGKKNEFNPYNLSRRDNDLINKLRSNITISVDKKTAIINISVKDQDPLVCKTVADSVRIKLQQFITEYRTNKARIDLNYYEKLASNAKQEYERARQLYGNYADANTDVILQSFRSKQEDLENDMQLKYNAYTTYSTQLQAARAKVQERTPAFTMIKGAAVPIKPAGPKRMFFVIGMLFFAFFGCILYIMKDDIKQAIIG